MNPLHLSLFPQIEINSAAMHRHRWPLNKNHIQPIRGYNAAVASESQLLKNIHILSEQFTFHCFALVFVLIKCKNLPRV